MKNYLLRWLDCSPDVGGLRPAGGGRYGTRRGLGANGRRRRAPHMLAVLPVRPETSCAHWRKIWLFLGATEVVEAVPAMCGPPG